jgi:hypothetical protein
MAAAIKPSVITSTTAYAVIMGPITMSNSRKRWIDIL